jgi:hypothetical protein
MAPLSTAPKTAAPWSQEWMAFVWSSLPGAALATAAAAGWVPISAALALFAVSFVGLNLMHMSATWSRVYGQLGWRSRPVERLLIPMGLAAFALGYEAIGGGAILLAAQYFLSFHHALMQNYGLLRVTQRRSGRNVDARLDLAACLLLPGAALLYRAAAVSQTYNGATLPPVSTALAVLLALPGIVALAAVARREWRAQRAGERVDPLGVGLLFGTNLIWSALLVGNPDPALPLYALASGHYAQYLFFVHRVEVRDARKQPEPASGLAELQAWLRGTPLRYLVALLILGGGVTVLLTVAAAGLRETAVVLGWRPATALDIPPWAAAMIGISLQHYWLDHRVWRSPRPAVAAPLPATA